MKVLLEADLELIKSWQKENLVGIPTFECVDIVANSNLRMEEKAFLLFALGVQYGQRRSH